MAGPERLFQGSYHRCSICGYPFPGDVHPSRMVNGVEVIRFLSQRPDCLSGRGCPRWSIVSRCGT